MSTGWLSWHCRSIVASLRTKTKPAHHSIPVANTKTLCIRMASDPAERPEAGGAEASPSDDWGRATTGGIIAQGASGEPARPTQLAAEAITGVPWCHVPPAPSQCAKSSCCACCLSGCTQYTGRLTTDDWLNAGTLASVQCSLHVQCVLV